MSGTSAPPAGGPAAAPAPDPAPAPARRRRRLDRLRVAMIVALAVQLLLGMANNLWLEQPEPDLDRASPGGLLNAHMSVGYVLVVLAIWVLVEAARLRRADYLVPAIAGFAGIALAFAAGSVYFTTEDDVWSYLMTIGFAVAVTSYALAGRRRPS